MLCGSLIRCKRDKYCIGMWVCEWAHVDNNKLTRNWAHVWSTRTPPAYYVARMRVYAPRRQVLNRKNSAELYLAITGLLLNLYKLKATATATGERFELSYARPLKLLPKRKRLHVRKGRCVNG